MWTAHTFLSIQFNSIIKIQISQTQITKQQKCIEKWINERAQTNTNKHTLTNDCEWPHVGFLTVDSVCNWFRCHPTHWPNSTHCLNYQIKSIFIININVEYSNQTILIHFINFCLNWHKYMLCVCCVTFPSFVLSRIRDIPKSYMCVFNTTQHTTSESV
jgi:hypothetical protein